MQLDHVMISAVARSLASPLESCGRSARSIFGWREIVMTDDGSESSDANQPKSDAARPADRWAIIEAIGYLAEIIVWVVRALIGAIVALLHACHIIN